MDKTDAFDLMMGLTPIWIRSDDHYVRIRLPDPPDDLRNVPRDLRGLEDHCIDLISYSRCIEWCEQRHHIVDLET